MFDIDRAREKLKGELASVAATLPEASAIWRVELDEIGRFSQSRGEKMVPLPAISSLKKGVDMLTDQGAYDFLLPAYLARAHSLGFSESAFQDVVTQIIKFRSSGCYRFTTFACLFGCSSPLEFQCGPLFIGPPDAHFYEVLFNTWGPLMRGVLVGFGEIGLEHIAKLNLLNAAVVIRFVTSVANVNDVPWIAHDISTLLKAIGLSHGVTKGLVLSPISTLSDLFHPGIASKVSYIHGFDLSQSDLIKPFELDTEAVRARYSELDRCAQISFLAPDIILSAMSRISLADKFVDLITALEACFVKISQEARYRLAISCAAVLGRSFAVYKEMLRLYLVRSGIVHGKIKPDNVKDDLVKLESYALPIVRYFLAELAQGNAINLEDANEKIDRLLLPEQ